MTACISKSGGSSSNSCKMSSIVSLLVQDVPIKMYVTRYRVMVQPYRAGHHPLLNG